MVDKVSQEELQAELEAMQNSGKHTRPHKRINRKVKRNRLTRITLIVILSITILLCLFVWFRSTVEEASKDGLYIIRIIDSYDENTGIGNGSSSGGFKKSALQLGYDKDFKIGESFEELIGKGYGNVSGAMGGTIIDNQEMNQNMFEKFRQLAENEDTAPNYKENVGNAYVGDEFYANKYFLKNTGNVDIEYRLIIEVSGNINNALDAARFMIVTEKPVQEGNLIYNEYSYQIFATPKTVRAIDEKGKEYAPVDERGFHTYQPNDIQEEVAYAIDYSVASSKLPYKDYFASPTGNDIVTSTELDNTSGFQLTTKDINKAWKCTNLKYNSLTTFWNYQSCKVDENNKYVSGLSYKLAPDEVTTYSLCVWFEGSDFDHNNSIIGGAITFSINYQIIND